MNKIFWDIETRGFDGGLIVGAYVLNDQKEPKLFYKIEDFIRELDRLKDSTICFAHNGGRFDNLDVIEYLKQNKRDFRLIPVNSYMLVEFKNRNGNTIKLYDTILLMPSSLKSLSTELCENYVKEDYDSSKLEYYDEWDNTGLFFEMDTLKHYLKYDVLSLREVYNKFFEMLKDVYHDLELDYEKYIKIQKKFTVAGVSHETLLNSVELNYGAVCKNYYTKEEEQFIRESYAGGRVEVFKTEAEDLTDYDANSLYPSVMALNVFPYGKKHNIDNAEDIRTALNMGWLGVIEVEVLKSTSEPAYLWTKENGKLLFKDITGKKGVYTSFEILEAEKLGYEFKFIKAIFHEKKAALFRDFADKLYEKRLEAKSKGQKAFQMVIKFVLNSSYGKFGQKREQSELFDLENITYDQKIELVEKYGTIENINGFGMIKRESYRNRNVNPIYATFITAYARDTLFRTFKPVYENLCYCDTDSIILEKNAELPPELLNKALGGWKIECKPKKALFVGAKQYYLEFDSINDIEYRLKGVPAKILNKYKKEDIKELFLKLKKGEEINLEFDRLYGLKELLRRKDTDKSKYRQICKVEKVIKSTVYEKRGYLDGVSTKML